MKKSVIWSSAILIILVVAVIIFSINKTPVSENNSLQNNSGVDTNLPPLPPMPPSPGTDTTAEVNIEIANFAFSPATITVSSGTTVTWTNNDAMSHTATSISGPESFDSGSFAKGSSYSFTFTKPGTYEYKCSIHPSMQGKIIVE